LERWWRSRRTRSRVQDFPSSQLGMDPAISDKYQFV
jgi:hypothetical protein